VSDVTGAEATSRFAETAMMRVHYHEAGPAQGSQASPDDAGASLPLALLHGDGPGASA